MRIKIISAMLLHCIFFMSQSSSAQIYLVKKDSIQTITINNDDRIKVLCYSNEKFEGVYDAIAYGRSKSLKFGTLLSLSDSTLIIKNNADFFKNISGRRRDTVSFNKVIGITKYKTRIVPTVLGVGLLATLVNNTSLTPVIILPALWVGMIGFVSLEDLVLHPPKRINSEKSEWELKFK